MSSPSRQRSWTKRGVSGVKTVELVDFGWRRNLKVFFMCKAGRR